MHLSLSSTYERQTEGNTGESVSASESQSQPQPTALSIAVKAPISRSIEEEMTARSQGGPGLQRINGGGKPVLVPCADPCCCGPARQQVACEADPSAEAHLQFERALTHSLPHSSLTLRPHLTRHPPTHPPLYLDSPTHRLRLVILATAYSHSRLADWVDGVACRARKQRRVGGARSGARIEVGARRVTMIWCCHVRDGSR